MKIISATMNHEPYRDYSTAIKLAALVEKHPNLAVLQIDANCAFNSMFREAMLEELETACPHLLTAFAQLL